MPKAFPQVVGDEGGVASGFGQLPFVEGEHDEVAEVEVTRFQHTHYLHADGGLSVEGDVGRGKQPVQQSLQRVCAHATQFAGLYQTEQAIDEGVALNRDSRYSWLKMSSTSFPGGRGRPLREAVR